MDTIFETNVYDSNNNYTDEYLKISKKGTQFLEYDFGYAIINVQIAYLGENLADGDFEVEFDDIELECTTVPTAE